MSDAITATSANSAAYAANSASGNSARKVGQTLGQDDFLQLLVAQLKNQDPLNPMSDTEFVSQMANFTSLQQTTDISNTLTAMASAMQKTGVTGYLGYQVDITTNDGSTVSGVVTKVGTNSKGIPTVTVNGIAYDASSITAVTVPTVAADTNTSEDNTNS